MAVDPRTGEASFTVVELAELLGRALAVTFPDDVWVEGEISDLSRSRSGHVYFDLVEPATVPGQEPTARLAVVLWKSHKDIVNALLRRHGGGVRMADGIRIRIRAVVDFYPPQGRLQLRMTSIDPGYTLGVLAAEREALLRRLRTEGLADRNAALAMPTVPLRVGLVTAAGSAAEADVLTELERSEFAWRVLAIDTPVQGAGAGEALAAAVTALAHRDVDVVALVRGGGSRNDLAAFDSEVLARAIATAPVPVLTGIGHELDRSVADDVAHASYKTPTACAAGLVGRVRDLLDALDTRKRLVTIGAERALHRASADLAEQARHCRRATRSALRDGEVRIDHAAGRTAVLAGRALHRAHDRLTARERDLARQAPRVLRQAEQDLLGRRQRLDALDPVRVLARGWSITTDGSGRVLRDAAQVRPGDEIVTRLATGVLVSEVRQSLPAADPPPTMTATDTSPRRP